MYCPLRNRECDLSCNKYTNCILLTAETKTIENANKLNTIEQQVKDIHNWLWQLINR